MLGEFEYLLITVAASLEDRAYGAAIREEIESTTGRRCSMGALYTTIDRLEEKGLLKTWMGEATPQRGGRAKRMVRVTPKGVQAAKDFYDVVIGVSRGASWAMNLTAMNKKREQYMTSWSFLEAASQLLPLDDREAVLGDLAEAEESPRQMLVEVLGLVVRRHLAPWKSWQPWLASFGLTLPSSFFLMGASVWVSSTLQRLGWQIVPTHDALLHLISIVFLLICWSWAAGFVVSSLSRRTLWVSAVACLMPCLFCLARFRTESLPRFSLFLFVLPAVLGVWQGMRTVRIRRSFATAVAVAVTMLMILTWSRGFLFVNVALLWPSWYIAAMAWEHGTYKEKRMTA